MFFRNINTNLAQDSFRCLKDGEWEIGLFSDNPNLEDESSDYFKDCEKDIIKDQNENIRCLKNKVRVLLMDGNYKKAHIIHLHPSEGYFCITNNRFWDQFED